MNFNIIASASCYENPELSENDLLQEKIYEGDFVNYRDI